jgi:Na+-translocating ferredoxin:NAD+ oxidoreductase subunit B
MGDVFERLAAALDRLANGFPRTPSGIEISILRKMFTPEEAAVAATLTAEPRPAEEVACSAGLAVDGAAATLGALAERDLVWVTDAIVRRFRLAPFLVGAFDAHMLTSRDPEYARLMEDHLNGGGGALIMAPQPAIHRVVPARGAVKREWVLPYEDVRAILLGGEAFRVKDCVCRVQLELAGRRDCSFPVANCLWFASSADTSAEGETISRAEALAILDEAEEVGLVHTVSNVAEGVDYVCNCCACCCHLLRGITDWGIARSVAQANYYALVDQEECTACGICEERCQVKAIAETDGTCVVDRDRCIGCGLCVSGCPSEAVHLHLKPPDEILPPPVDFAAWERQRLRDRGLL